ncbi:MAG: T9SS type A sorting domain-containing protein, partial [Bacteroidetes bacterium]|nr:T9SS type A sorting domain-containing protein [Bacteroidota bacterium]
VDHSYIGSPFSVEGQFTVTASGKSGTDVADEGDLPRKLTLYPGFPNPFAAQTTLSYDLPEPALVRMSVYDVLGKEIGLLVDDVQAAGRHSVSWDARSRAGNPLGAGVYFVRMSAGSQVLGTTLIILK